MFQENKARQIFRKTNIFYLLIRTGGKFGVLCFLETPVLRLALLPYHLNIVSYVFVLFVSHGSIIWEKLVRFQTVPKTRSFLHLVRQNNKVLYNKNSNFISPGYLKRFTPSDRTISPKESMIWEKLTLFWLAVVFQKRAKSENISCIIWLKNVSGP